MVAASTRRAVCSLSSISSASGGLDCSLQARYNSSMNSRAACIALLAAMLNAAFDCSERRPGGLPNATEKE